MNCMQNQITFEGSFFFAQVRFFAGYYFSTKISGVRSAKC